MRLLLLNNFWEWSFINMMRGFSFANYVFLLTITLLGLRKIGKNKDYLLIVAIKTNIIVKLLKIVRILEDSNV